MLCQRYLGVRYLTLYLDSATPMRTSLRNSLYMSAQALQGYKCPVTSPYFLLTCQFYYSWSFLVYVFLCTWLLLFWLRTFVPIDHNEIYTTYDVPAHCLPRTFANHQLRHSQVSQKRVISFMINDHDTHTTCIILTRKRFQLISAWADIK